MFNGEAFVAAVASGGKGNGFEAESEAYTITKFLCV
jgi:hypothetical protein